MAAVTAGARQVAHARLYGPAVLPSVAGVLVRPPREDNTAIIVQHLRVVNTTDEDAALTLKITPGWARPTREYAPMVLADRPVAYWRMGEDSGPIHDPVGLNDGVAVGGVSFGQPGAMPLDANTSILFDGSSGYFLVPDAPNLRVTGDLTIEVWANQFASAQVEILSKANSTNPGPYRFQTLPGARLNYRAGIGSNNLQALPLPATGLYSFGAWHHLAVTVLIASRAVAYYVDGNPVGTAVIDLGPIGDGGYPVAIGAITNPATRFFNGYLQDLALYDHALSADRVLAHAQASGPFTDAIYDGFVIPAGATHDWNDAELPLDAGESLTGFSSVANALTATISGELVA